MLKVYECESQFNKTMGNFELSLCKPFIVFALLSSLLLISQSSMNKGLAQAGNLWYVGDGAKKDMYVTYRVQEQDTNAGRPFDMTIYFKEYNETGKYWVAPTFVVDQGRVLNGTLHLSDLDLTALGTSQIPPEMAKYRSGYSSSLKWLSAFVAKPGQSLTAQNWGKIASIGGSPITPAGKATITTPAGTFDTTTILYHKGVDNTIWIKDGFPYPIKAQTFADITTGNPPTQYAFELLATGQGQPKSPESKEQIPVPPLEQRTERGSYVIRLIWEPTTIKAGNNTKFGIIFMDDKKNVITGVGYNFAVVDAKGQLIYGKDNQLAPDGTAVQNVIFQNPGEATVKVLITTAGSGSPSNFVESGEFGLVVQ
ncbi:MAG: hypothetical protein QOK51_06565 [Nitrososphaeraceae archaeon]|nr:hypothetical protein [Nitrososphaeraceae archaeon]